MPGPKAKQFCPDLSQFQRLVSAQLSDTDKEAVLYHLEGCDSCAQKLNGLPEHDTLVGLLRRAETLGDEASSKNIARLVERLSKLRPSKPPAAAEPAPPLTFTCPSCGKVLKIKGAFAGKAGRCPHCKAAMRVPAASASAQGHAKPSGRPVSEQSLLTLPPSLSNVPPSMEAIAADSVYQEVRAKDQKYDFLAPPQATDELGRLGPYRVLQVLGAGGMGVVFRAEDLQLARPVALKAMLPSIAGSDSARLRFLREARAAAAISHDHIITVYQVGEDRGVPYLAMQFLEGEPLNKRLQREGKLSIAEVIRIGREIALGLAAAHQRELIHRDIKPANIWLESQPGAAGGTACGGRVKLLDFGLARAVREEGQLTQMGVIVGTPAYMAPEQAQGKSIDGRCDLFSLGCVLYRMATGGTPFTGADMISTLMAVATHNPSLPHELNAAMPKALSELIMRLLAKEAEDRPASAQVVAETLERLASEQTELLAAGKPKAGPATAHPVRKAPAPVVDRSPFDELDNRTTPTFATKKERKKGRAVLVAQALALALLVSLGIWLAIILLRVETSNGTLIVEIEKDADVEALIKKGKLILTGPDGKIRYELSPSEHNNKIDAGSYKIRVKGADGLVLDTPEFTLKKGDEVKVRVTLKPKEVVKEDPPKLDPDRKEAEAKAESKEVVPAGPGVPKKGDVITNSIGMKLVSIPGGKFTMGSPKGEVGHRDDEKEHLVEISSFNLGVHEVTQKQFREVMGYNPSIFSKSARGKPGVVTYVIAPGGWKDKIPAGDDTEDYPVENVSWVEAKEFCEKLRYAQGIAMSSESSTMPPAQWQEVGPWFLHPKSLT